MKKNQRLPKPILTPSTKAAKGDHDISVSQGRAARDGPHRARGVRPRGGDRRAAVRGRAGARGEAGPDPRRHQVRDGPRRATATIVVIDEIHTPDSSRYWYADDYEERLARGEEPRSLDKEYVRRWLANEAKWNGDGPPPVMPDEVRIEAARRYIASYELVTGKTFVPDHARADRADRGRAGGAVTASPSALAHPSGPRRAERGRQGERARQDPRRSAPRSRRVDARWVHLVVADARADGRRARRSSTRC